MRRSVETYVESDEPVGRETVAEIPPPIGALLGFEPVAMEPGSVTLEMEASPRFANPMGTLHGGVLCDLGDAAMGYSYASTLSEEESFTTLELDVKFLKPVWKGTLRAEGNVVKGGRTVGLVECDVTDAEGSLVARLESVCLTLRDEMAAGR
ncbi:PaaI family thioesterase [Halosegnis marinus]